MIPTIILLTWRSCGIRIGLDLIFKMFSLLFFFLIKIEYIYLLYKINKIIYYLLHLIIYYLKKRENIYIIYALFFLSKQYIFYQKYFILNRYYFFCYLNFFESYVCRGKIDFAYCTNCLQQKKHSAILRYSLNADLEDAYHPPWILARFAYFIYEYWRTKRTISNINCGPSPDS